MTGMKISIKLREDLSKKAAILIVEVRLLDFAMVHKFCTTLVNDGNKTILNLLVVQQPISSSNLIFSSVATL